MSNMTETQKEAVVKKVRSYENAATIIWMVIGTLQVLAGLSGVFWLLIIGGFNLYGGYTYRERLPRITDRDSKLVKEYEDDLLNIIFIGAANLFLGGVIGVIAAVIDLVNRSYVIKNAEAFDNVAEEDNEGEDVEAN